VGFHILVGMKNVWRLLHQHRFRVLVVLFVFLAVDLGLLMVPIEGGDPRANIRSIGDGVWWAVTTMTGVGFGDVYPVTTLGRVAGMVLEILGVLVFGLIVGHIAVALFRVQDDFNWRRMFERLDEMEKRLERIEKMAGYQVKNGNKDESK